MKRLIITTGLLLILNAPLLAATQNLVCYLDAGVLNRQLVVSKGYAETSVPGSMMQGTLRVKPGNGVVITRVQTMPARVDLKTAKALSLLDDRRDLLGDRLKALQTREEIFTAAAKSQSAKAPRKTKANPEPMIAIRQGTDLALARLEEVYRLRRAAEKELKAVEAKRNELSRKANVGGSNARIWTQGKTGMVSVEYAQNDAGWKPVYDIRVDGTEHVALTLRASLPQTEPGTVVMVIAGLLTSPDTAPTPLAASGDYAPVATYTLPVVVSTAFTPFSPLAMSVTNATSLLLPSGDASCYFKGEYRGTVHFPSVMPGERKDLICGRIPETGIDSNKKQPTTEIQRHGE